MFLIVLHHMCLFYAGGEGLKVRASSIMTAFATDAFAFISGFYGMKFKAMKVVRMLAMGVFATVVLWLLGIIVLRQRMPYVFSLGWFGNSYLALMFIVPFINAGVERLSENRRNFTMAYFGYAFAMLLSWLPKTSFLNLNVAGWMGHSFNTLLFLYITGRYVRSLTMDRIQTWVLWLVFVGAMMCHIVFVAGLNFCVPQSVASILNSMRDFNAPWLLLAAVVSVVGASRLRCPPWLNKIAGLLAPSMFVVYLLHEGGNPLVSRAVYGYYGRIQGLNSASGC